MSLTIPNHPYSSTRAQASASRTIPQPQSTPPASLRDLFAPVRASASSEAGRNLALAGARHTERMGETPQGRQVGEDYLKSLATHQDTTSVEKAVSNTAWMAAHGGLSSPSACRCQQAALRMVAAGLRGPASTDIATLGLQALQGGTSSDDRRSLGWSFLKGVMDHGNEAGQAVGAYSLNATAHAVRAENAVKCQTRALEMASEGLQDSPTVSLATLGTRVLDDCSQPEDLRDGNVMGYELLRGIELSASTDAEKKLATAAHQAVWSAPTDVEARRIELQAFATLRDVGA